MLIIYSQALQLSFYVNFIQNLLHKISQDQTGKQEKLSIVWVV